MRIKDCVFSAILLLILLSPALLLGAERILNLELPGWATATNATYLSGGISDKTIRDKVTRDGINSKELQDALEERLGNFVPAKATALLGNAPWQRTAIALSNSIFYGTVIHRTLAANTILSLPSTPFAKHHAIRR